MNERDYYRPMGQYAAGRKKPKAAMEADAKFLLGLLVLVAIVGVCAISTIAWEAMQDQRPREPKARKAAPPPQAAPQAPQMPSHLNMGFLPGGIPRPESEPELDPSEIVQELTEPGPSEHQPQADLEAIRQQAEADARHKALMTARAARELVVEGLDSLLAYRGSRGQMIIHPYTITRLSTIVPAQREYRRVQVQGGDKQVRETDGFILVQYEATPRTKRGVVRLERAAVIHLDGQQFIGGVSLDSEAARARYRETLQQYEIPLREQREPQQPQRPSLIGRRLSLGAGI